MCAATAAATKGTAAKRTAEGASAATSATS